MKIVPAFASIALVALSVAAQHASLPYVNIDKSGLALQGYDPVAYFTDGKAVKGLPSISAGYQGATYRFATEEHRSTFRADPAKYAPQFGGFCGYAVSQGYTAEIDPEAFTIMDGKLILQYSKSVLEKWKKDAEGYLAKANQNWPGIEAKNQPKKSK